MKAGAYPIKEMASCERMISSSGRVPDSNQRLDALNDLYEAYVSDREEGLVQKEVCIRSRERRCLRGSMYPIKRKASSKRRYGPHQEKDVV